MKDIFDKWRDYSSKKTIKKLRFFDFDETIAYTQSNVRVTPPGSEEITLADQKEFDIYAKKKAKEHGVRGYDPVPGLEKLGYQFDFTDFAAVRSPEENKMITKIIGHIIDANKKDPIRELYVITARRDVAKGPIESYLRELGFSLSDFEDVITLAGASKREKIEEIIAKHTDDSGETTIESIHFFDDSKKNLKDVKQLRQLYPQIKDIQIKHVVKGDILSLENKDA
tara:strand:- start:75 stop:752 length:678 start_codon:yes stop_codon:yes gene_type:complete